MIHIYNYIGAWEWTAEICKMSTIDMHALEIEWCMIAAYVNDIAIESKRTAFHRIVWYFDIFSLMYSFICLLIQFDWPCIALRIAEIESFFYMPNRRLIGDFNCFYATCDGDDNLNRYRFEKKNNFGASLDMLNDILVCLHLLISINWLCSSHPSIPL